MRRLIVAVAACLALSGCGVLDDQGPAAPKPPDPAVYGPSKPAKAAAPTLTPAPPAEPSPAVARALEHGAIGVADLSGTVAIEPASLDTAADLTLRDVRWSSWGARGAKGTGTLRILTCQPTCAASGFEDVAARIALSGVKTCAGRRYFEHGEVSIDPVDGTQPVTYLRAPC